MYELVPIIRDLAIMLSVASVVVLIFQKIRHPIILGYIISGLIVGPYTLPYSLVTNIAQIHILSELGIIFLMFTLGLDFSFHKLKRTGFSAIITGLLKVPTITILGFYFGKLMQWKFYDSLFLGLAFRFLITFLTHYLALI